MRVPLYKSYEHNGLACVYCITQTQLWSNTNVNYHITYGYRQRENNGITDIALLENETRVPPPPLDLFPFINNVYSRAVLLDAVTSTNLCSTFRFCLYFHALPSTFYFFLQMCSGTLRAPVVRQHT